MIFGTLFTLIQSGIIDACLLIVCNVKNSLTVFSKILTYFLLLSFFLSFFLTNPSPSLSFFHKYFSFFFLSFFYFSNPSFFLSFSNPSLFFIFFHKSFTLSLFFHKSFSFSFLRRVSSWCNGSHSGLLNRCKRVRSPVGLLRSLLDKYPWKRYEPPYPPSNGLIRRMALALNYPRRLVCH